MRGSCPSCGRSYEIGDEFLQMGGKAKCPHCLRDLIFPGAARPGPGPAVGRDPRLDPTRVLDPERPRPQAQAPEELDAHCPACRRRFKIDRDYLEAGNPAMCPRCDQPLTVEEPPIPQAPNRAWEENTGEVTDPRGRLPEEDAGPETAAAEAPLQDEPPADLSAPGEEDEAPPAEPSETSPWGDTMQINLPELAELQSASRAPKAEPPAPPVEDLFAGLPDESGSFGDEDRGPTERMQLSQNREAPAEAVPPGESLGTLDEDHSTVEFDAAQASALAVPGESEEVSDLGPASAQASADAGTESLPDLSDSPEETQEASAVLGQSLAPEPEAEVSLPAAEGSESPAPASPSRGATGEFEAGLPLSALDGMSAAPAGASPAAESLLPPDASTPLSHLQPAEASAEPVSPAEPAPSEPPPGEPAATEPAPADKPFARLAATEDWAEAARRWAEGGFKAEDMPAFIRSDSHPPSAPAPQANETAPAPAPAPAEPPAPVTGPTEVEVSDSDIIMLDDGEVQEIGAPKVIVAPQTGESWAARASVEIQKQRQPQPVAPPAPSRGAHLLSRLASPPILGAVLGVLALAALALIWWLRSRSAGDAPVEFPAPKTQGAVLQAKAPAPAEPRAKEEALRHYALGNRLAYQGRLEDAILEYQQAVRLDPAFPHPHRAMGSCYAALGKSSLSITAYQGYLSRAPDAPDAGAVKDILKAARGEKQP
jgi:tetratricopeptide (TPR) repeat protein